MALTEAKQKAAAKAFTQYREDKGYDKLTMPPELRKAHQANDRAVMAAYGFPVRNFTESDCVAALMKMYQELTTKEGN